MEAEYAMDDRTALNLYDCLIPKLRENRRFLVKKNAALSIADFKAQIQVKSLDLQLEK